MFNWFIGFYSALGVLSLIFFMVLLVAATAFIFWIFTTKGRAGRIIVAIVLALAILLSFKSCVDIFTSL